MIEVEAKAPAGPGTAEALEERGEVADRREETDVYYRHPCRDLAATDEAVRVRRTGDGAALTYKGPRRGGETKTRSEHETTVADPAEAGAILERLGFTPLAPVRKERVVYEVGAWTVTLDDVEGLGRFVEVERVVGEGADVEALEAEALDLLEDLGAGDPEPRSYLELVLGDP